jgi:hypothetical protein
MSANQWGGLLLRGQSRKCIEVVSRLVNEHELFTEVDHLQFAALARTKLTWVSFTPFDEFEDLEELLEGSRALVKDLARALRAELWIVANNDYSGTDYLSFDATGRRRWKALDTHGWSSKIEARVDRAVEKQKTAAARRTVEATRKALLAQARAKSPLGRLEAEAGLEWEACVDLFGEAKKTVWRKKVRYQPPGREPEPRPSKRARVNEPPPEPLPVDPLAEWRSQSAGALRALIWDRTRKLVELHLPVTTYRRMEETSKARDTIPDLLVDSLWSAADAASLEVHLRDPSAPTIERHMSLSGATAAALQAFARKRGVHPSDVIDTLARGL